MFRYLFPIPANKTYLALVTLVFLLAGVSFAQPGPKYSNLRADEDFINIYKGVRSVVLFYTIRTFFWSSNS